MPWRGKARARETEGDGKLAERLGRKEERRNESQCLLRTNVDQNEGREHRVKQRKEVRQMRRR